MTLQQKMLAKQSKKGFTLVELVVVIAILGILAAIAIPAVIGIIDSANKSQLDSDAATIDSACKDYYAGVKSGTITNADNKADGAAAPGAITTVRETAADACTVANAMKYAGISEQASKLGDMSVTAEGTIFRTGNNKYTKVNSITLGSGTTLGTLYKQAAATGGQGGTTGGGT